MRQEEINVSATPDFSGSLFPSPSPAMNRTYQIFYSFYTDDAHIDGGSPITVSAAELPQYFSRLQQHHDFLGIIDRHDNTFQILLEEFSGFYWGEIPDPVKVGAHGRFYSAEE
ncbi:MAG: hypothetical protein E7I45_11260, partial [Eikenella corrodens]